MSPHTTSVAIAAGRGSRPAGRRAVPLCAPLPLLGPTVRGAAAAAEHRPSPPRLASAAPPHASRCIPAAAHATSAAPHPRPGARTRPPPRGSPALSPARFPSLLPSAGSAERPPPTPHPPPSPPPRHPTARAPRPRAARGNFPRPRPDGVGLCAPASAPLPARPRRAAGTVPTPRHRPRSDPGLRSERSGFSQRFFGDCVWLFGFWAFFWLLFSVCWFRFMCACVCVFSGFVFLFLFLLQYYFHLKFLFHVKF